MSVLVFKPIAKERIDDHVDIRAVINTVPITAHVYDSGKIVYDAQFRLDSVLHSLLKDLKKDDDPIEYVTGIKNREYLDWTMRELARYM